MPDIRKVTGSRKPTTGQPTKPGVKYPTPDVTNDFLIIERDTRDSKEAPIAYGTAHALSASAKLIEQRFEAEEDNKKTRVRIYSANGTPAQQDVYNFALSYSGESNSHQILIRSYTIPRAGYTPVAKGTADTAVTGAKLVKEDAQPIEGDNVNLRVIRIFETIPGPALTGKAMSSEYGGGVLDTTEQVVAAGTAVEPTFRTVSHSVSPDGANKSILQKAELPSEETWPTLREREYIPQLNAFVTTEKTVIARADSGQDGSRTTASDVIITEYRDIDKWRTIQIVSKLPESVIGSTRTFRKNIQYSIPDEIPVAPSMIKAYSVKPMPSVPGTFLDDLFAEASVTDVELDYSLIEGFRGTFSAIVTRTISLTSATETEYQWFPRAERKNIPVTLNFSQAASGGARGKILRLGTPSAIHGTWNVPAADIFTFAGTKVWEYTDATYTTQIPGSPFTAWLSSSHVITSQYWRIQPIVTRETLNFSCDATTPAAIPHGASIIAAVNSEEWRFGVWVNDVYRIVVP